MEDDFWSRMAGPAQPQGKPQRRSWRLPALIFFLAFLALREAGVISLNLYKSSSQSSWSSSFSGRTSNSGGQKLAMAASVVTGGYLVGTTGDPVAGKALKSTFLSSSPPLSATSARVSVTKLDIQGAYWVPLYKSAICRFAATATRTPSANAHYNGTISGTIELKVIGLCSSHEFRKKLGQMVASAIVKERWDTRTK